MTAGRERTDDPPAPADEWTIQSDGYVAAISAVGASLRSLSFHGRDLVVPYPRGAVRPFYRGATIAPWPNRIRDGRYRFHGNDFQLPINEVARGVALHGLVHWVRWELLAHTGTGLTLRHRLVPQDGYPFELDLVEQFELGPDGLTSTLTALNAGQDAAPYGCCPHPYLVAGSGRVDDWELTAPARSRLEVDHRLLPTDLVEAAAVGCDFRRPLLLATREIDHAFTDLDRDADGMAAVTLRHPVEHTGVRISWDVWAPWLQLHTADRPEPQHHRVGLAVEPMSCPPDAFNTAEPPVLAPGARHRAAWTVTGLS